SPAVLEAVTGFHVHRGALASVARPPLPDAPTLLAGACRLAVLEDVNNPTNLGALFRSAAALGMGGVLLSPGCADPLYRRAVRVSMGEVLAVPYARLAPWPAALAEVRAAGFELLALTPAAGAEPLDRVEVGPRDRVAVLLGAEGPGLTPAALAAAGRAVRIPMAAGVDSLNVAAAAAVAFWVLGRRRA
ncbi:MAG TPA: RNA methyltransferase, partial [Actinomycetota bacterium]|nr:RNA methyltransferase [Actinomycetota bacterium]